MATPGKPKKKELKKHIPVKTSLDSPFTLTWSPLPQEDMEFILKTLTLKVTSVGLEKKEVKTWKRKKAQKSAAVTAESSEPVVQQQDTPSSSWTHVSARRQLAIGINEVTKALERNELKLVLVCKSVKPKHMTSHLITLSATRGVPACQVPRLSCSLSGPLGLKSVLALGFRRCSSSSEDVFIDIIDVIKVRVPPLNVPWLPAAGSTETLEAPAAGSEETAAENRGQKRKLEAECEEVTESPSVCSLQPLKVKRIVANPVKKKKSKVKKK